MYVPKATGSTPTCADNPNQRTAFTAVQAAQSSGPASRPPSLRTSSQKTELPDLNASKEMAMAPKKTRITTENDESKNNNIIAKIQECSHWISQGSGPGMTGRMLVLISKLPENKQKEAISSLSDKAKEQRQYEVPDENISCFGVNVPFMRKNVILTPESITDKFLDSIPRASTLNDGADFLEGMMAELSPSQKKSIENKISKIPSDEETTIGWGNSVNKKKLYESTFSRQMENAQKPL
jgi:hypothetical protein